RRRTAAPGPGSRRPRQPGPPGRPSRRHPLARAGRLGNNRPSPPRRPPMKWRSARRSSNVDDRRGRGGGGGMKLGLGGVAIIVVIGLLMGKNPMEMLGMVAQMQQQAPAGSSGPAQAPPANDEASQFVAAILGETEDVWTAVFEASGSRYTPATLVLFTGQVQSACGGASAAVGPFYCPADKQVYIDLSFFEQMERRLGGGGDFAEAYVIAHEV